MPAFRPRGTGLAHVYPVLLSILAPLSPHMHTHIVKKHFYLPLFWVLVFILETNRRWKDTLELPVAILTPMGARAQS